MEGNIISQEDIFLVLDKLYSKVLGGVKNVSPKIEEFAEDYSKKSKTNEEAAKKLIKNQIAKCTTSGFITGLGGFITLPIAIPANIGSVMYVQMRMIAGIAYLAGYDLHSDQVQTLVYACLAGVSVNNVLKKVGVEVGKKVANKTIEKIPGKVMVAINKKVGYRFITKAGTTGTINLTKSAIPVVGGFIGGSFDFVETKLIANRAYKWFFEGNMSGDDEYEIIFKYSTKEWNSYISNELLILDCKKENVIIKKADTEVKYTIKENDLLKIKNILIANDRLLKIKAIPSPTNVLDGSTEYIYLKINEEEKEFNTCNLWYWKENISKCKSINVKLILKVCAEINNILKHYNVDLDL